jgi:hypothetical protein
MTTTASSMPAAATCSGTSETAASAAETAMMPVMVVVKIAAVVTADVEKAIAVTVAVVPAGAIIVVPRRWGAFIIQVFVDTAEKRQPGENQSCTCQRTHNLSHNGLTNKRRRGPKELLEEEPVGHGTCRFRAG